MPNRDEPPHITTETTARSRADRSLGSPLTVRNRTTSNLGLVEAKRGDPQNGWDTDQFPNSVEELTLALYEILHEGGMGTGGFDFVAKPRRQSLDPVGLFHGYVGAMDVIAEPLLRAVAPLEARTLQSFADDRDSGWSQGPGREIAEGKQSLEALHAVGSEGGIDPRPRSGRQEQLENHVNDVLRQGR